MRVSRASRWKPQPPGSGHTQKGLPLLLAFCSRDFWPWFLHGGPQPTQPAVSQPHLGPRGRCTAACGRGAVLGAGSEAAAARLAGGALCCGGGRWGIGRMGTTTGTATGRLALGTLAPGAARARSASLSCRMVR